MKNEFLKLAPDTSDTKPVKIIIRLPWKLHQKLKTNSAITGRSMKDYVTRLIELDLMTTEFSEHEIPKEKLEGDVKNLIVTMDPVLHQKIKIATAMHGTSIQAYCLYLIQKDLSRWQTGGK